MVFREEVRAKTIREDGGGVVAVSPVLQHGVTCIDTLTYRHRAKQRQARAQTAGCPALLPAGVYPRELVGLCNETHVGLQVPPCSGDLLSPYRLNYFERVCRRHRDDRLTQASRHWRTPSHTTKPLQPKPCPAYLGVHYYRPRDRLTSAPALSPCPRALDPRDAAEAPSPRRRPARPAMALTTAGPMHTDADAGASGARIPALLDPSAPPHNRRVPPH